MPRKRSPHPGVVVIPARPEKRQGAAIKYRDPDSGKFKTERIPEGSGKDWLLRRALELAQRRQELQAGAPRVTGNALSELVEAYFREAVLRPSTAAMYRLSTNQLERWAPGAQVRSGDDLTLARLRELRAWLVRLPARGPQSTNRDLRTLAAVLEHSRKAGRCVRLSRDAITDGLQRIKAVVERKQFLAEPRIALRQSVGDPELQVHVAFLLLTGMRASEALSLTVSCVDFKAGLIRLEGRATKTSLYRDVELSWTPLGYMLCELLAAGYEPSRRLFAPSKHVFRRLRRMANLDWNFQTLRRTCSTFLCSMPSVGLWRAAKSLGHHPEIARKHYAGVVRVDHTELECAMGIRDELVHLLVAQRALRAQSGADLPLECLVRALRAPGGRQHGSDSAAGDL